MTNNKRPVTNDSPMQIFDLTSDNEITIQATAAILLDRFARLLSDY
jgi:hypothetical protein